MRYRQAGQPLGQATLVNLVLAGLFLATVGLYLVLIVYKLAKATRRLVL